MPSGGRCKGALRAPPRCAWLPRLTAWPCGAAAPRPGAPGCGGIEPPRPVVPRCASGLQRYARCLRVARYGSLRLRPPSGFFAGPLRPRPRSCALGRCASARLRARRSAPRRPPGAACGPPSPAAPRGRGLARGVSACGLAALSGPLRPPCGGGRPCSLRGPLRPAAPPPGCPPALRPLGRCAASRLPPGGLCGPGGPLFASAPRARGFRRLRAVDDVPTKPGNPNKKGGIR